MIRKSVVGMTMVLVLVALAFSPVPAAHAAEGLPSYQLQFIGPGSPVAINNNNVIIGVSLSGNNYTPLVSVDASPWVPLPVPAGAVSVLPQDINEANVIVGVSYDAQMQASAVRWTPAAGGYTVEVLPRLPGDAASYATAINNQGQIVGSRGALGYVPTGTGWVFSDETGMISLRTAYGWEGAPSDINESGQVIAGTQRLDLNTGQIVDIGSGGPSNYYAITAVKINDQGMLAGYAAMRSSSLNIVSAFHNDGVSGWRFIDGTTRYTRVVDLNNLGDMAYSEQGAGLYLHGLGKYYPYTLLDPAVTNAGWVLTGSGVVINDQRTLVTIARNNSTGENGAVLLTVGSTLQPPTAPANLQGVAYEATWQRPFHSIELTWESTSPLTRSFELERRVVGEANWMQIPLSTTYASTNYSDTNITAGLTYEYRVRAVGLAGRSPWSDTVTVAAPTTPLDKTPPTVTILTPANGASVSGTVTVSAQASDNVGVEYFRISYWDQYYGQEIILGEVSNAGSLTVSWDTRSLTPATYTLSAYANDALGNWTKTDISVNVTAAAKSLKVSSISLSGTVSSGRANITGYVYVKDASGRSVSNASVAVRWTLPGGATRTATATTDLLGRARFTVSGARGTYVLTVTGVNKSGYVFDPAGSVLSKSITR